MNPHFFTAPFYFAFSWFRVQGSGLSWRLRRLFLEDGILVSQPSPLGNAIKLSGRTFLAPRRGEGGYAAVLHESVGLIDSVGLFNIARYTAGMPHLARLEMASHWISASLRS